MEKSKDCKIFNSILEAIGSTPMIRLNRIPKEFGVECEVLAKCEFMNPTGSHKDRLALNLIETAEKEGKLKEGGTIIEATSGNTGLSLSFVGAVKGYKTILVVVPKTSCEKIDLIRGFGADVIKGKVNDSKSPDGVFAIADKLKETIPGSFYTSQFTNMANPETHYKSTSLEIYEQCGGKIDCLFMSAGTGGTISGTSRRLKERLPSLKVLGCDPVGSLIGSPGGMYLPFKVEGVGYDFVPKTCNLTLIDEWLKFNDTNAFNMARKLTKEEGLLCGGSAGGIMWCALDYAKKMKLTKDQTIVVILPDTGRNYLTKQLNNEWLLEYKFIDEDAYRKIVFEDSLFPEKRFGDDLKLKDLDCKEVPILKLDTTIEEAWKVLIHNPVAVVNKTGKAADEEFKGTIMSKDVLAAISSGKLKFEDPISKLSLMEFCMLSENLKVSTVGKILESKQYVFFVRDDTKKACMACPEDIMLKMKTSK